MITRLHSISPIPAAGLSAIDLRAEFALASTASDRVQAYRARAAKPDGTPEAQALDVLHVPGSGRIGIAWGSDAQWADINDNGTETVETLVEMYLSDPSSFAARS